MSEQRTEGQEQERGQGSATLSKEQIELIGTILEPRFEKVEDRFDTVIAEMRLMTNEAVKEMRGALDTAVKDLRTEIKGDMRQQSTIFCWVIGGLVAIWLAAAGIAVSKWPQATPVAPAAPVAQAAPVAPAEPPDLIEPPGLSQP